MEDEVVSMQDVFLSTSRVTPEGRSWEPSLRPGIRPKCADNRCFGIALPANFQVVNRN
jgi:hypothetical protein